MAIELPEDVRAQLIGSIKRYCVEQLEMEAGDLKAQLLLDFILREVGPSIYNHAITDARAYFQGKVEDLEGSCYEPEFQYWTK
jgi:uncharacterized protein (DUF2164 family)